MLIPHPSNPDCPDCVPGSLLLQWQITERCNLRCRHCYQDETPVADLDHSDLLGILEQFKQLVTTCRNTSNKKNFPAQITLTGGEPFVRRDFPKLVETIASQRDWLRFAILTNGTMIDKDTAAWLKKLAVLFVQVSLEGMQATHDSIRGQGNFVQTLRAIRHLVEAKVPTMISFTAHRQNYRQFTEVARLGCRLKVQRVWSDRLIPAGRNQQELIPESLSPAETFEWVKLMSAARQKANRDWFNKTDVSTHRALQFLESGTQPYRCSAGSSLICAMANGDLVPCRRMPIVVGNLLKKPLADLYQCELFRSLRNPKMVNTGCQNCFFVHLCAGGLRCLSYALTGSPFNADPGCWHAKYPPSQKNDT